MKRRPWNAEAVPGIWKRRFSLKIIVEEADAAEKRALMRREFYAKAAQGCHPIRHQAFAASLIDRRRGPIGNDHSKTFLASRKRGSEPGRTATNNEDIDFAG